MNAKSIYFARMLKTLIWLNEVSTGWYEHIFEFLWSNQKIETKLKFFITVTRKPIKVSDGNYD